MASVPVISAIRLAGLFRVQPITLRSWDLRPVDPAVPRWFYAHEEVDRFMQAHSHGFKSPPTLQDLLERRLRLVSTGEALALAPRLTEDGLRRRVRRGMVPTIRPTHTTQLYHRDSVLNLAVPPPQGYTSSQVGHILGLRRLESVQELIKSGRLKAMVNPVALNRHLVLHESLLDYLGDPAVLPNIGPEEWLELRLVSPHRLIYRNDAAGYLAVRPRELSSLAEDGLLDFILSPAGKERWYAPESLTAYIEDTQPVTGIQLAHIFGVSSQTVSVWRAAGTLQCQIHHHVAGYNVLHRACVVAMLRTQLSPGMKAGLWYHERMRTTTSLMPLTEAAALLHMPPPALARAAETGEIGGIRAFSGRWRFARRPIVLLVRKRGRG